MFGPATIIYFRDDKNGYLDITETITGMNGASENLYTRIDYVELEKDIKKTKFWFFDEEGPFTFTKKIKDEKGFLRCASFFENIKDHILSGNFCIEVQNKEQKDKLLNILYEGYNEFPLIDYLKY